MNVGTKIQFEKMRVKMICMANAKLGNGMLRSLIGIHYQGSLLPQRQRRPQWMWLSTDGKRRGIESGLVVDLGPGDVLEFEVLDRDQEENCSGLVRVDPFSILIQGTLSPKELSMYLLANNCLGMEEGGIVGEGLYVEEGRCADAMSVVKTREGRVTGLQLSYWQCVQDGSKRAEGPVWDPRFMELIEVMPEVLQDVDTLLLVRMGTPAPRMLPPLDPILAVLL